MKCTLLKAKPFQYMTLAVALSFSTISDSYAWTPSLWNEPAGRRGGGAGPGAGFGAGPVECPPITAEQILAYANNLNNTRTNFDRDWNVTVRPGTVSNLKAGDISSPHLECRPDGSRLITYKVKRGKTYIDQEATAFPKKRN